MKEVMLEWTASRRVSFWQLEIAAKASLQAAKSTPQFLEVQGRWVGSVDSTRKEPFRQERDWNTVSTVSKKSCTDKNF